MMNNYIDAGEARYTASQVNQFDKVMDEIFSGIRKEAEAGNFSICFDMSSKTKLIPTVINYLTSENQGYKAVSENILLDGKTCRTIKISWN